MQTYTVESSKAFVERFQLKPYQTGRLNGLSFALKDLIDVGGHITGGGNPSWANSHAKAAVNAVCVEQLLLEGANCIGKSAGK